MSAPEHLNFAQFRDQGLANLAKVPHPGNPRIPKTAIRSADVGFQHHPPNTDESFEGNIMHGKMMSYLTKNHALPPAKREDVPVGNIHTNQSMMHRPGVEKYLNEESYPDLPQVTRYKGKNWVDDGHHRIAAFMLGGAQTIPAMVREVHD